MNCNPTLTADEFQRIHNALYELRNLRDRFENVIHPDLFSRFTQSIADIGEGLRGAYLQDDHAYVIKNDHFMKVQEDLGLTAVWSLYEVDDLNAPHPFDGVQAILYHNHWGPKAVRIPINGLTWAALYVAADAAIRDSGDSHHIFIEQLKQVGEVLVLGTGS